MSGLVTAFTFMLILLGQHFGGLAGELSIRLHEPLFSVWLVAVDGTIHGQLKVFVWKGFAVRSNAPDYESESNYPCTPIEKSASHCLTCT